MDHSSCLTEACRKILRHFHRVQRPTFLGDLAIEVGFNIETTMKFVNSLLDDKLIRLATQQELRSLGASEGAVVYVLVGKIDPKLSHTP